MTAPRKLAVLGATGSIGCSALSLAWSFRDRLQVTALAGHRNVGLLAEAVRRFRPAAAAVAGEVERRALAELLSDLRRPPEILIGPEGLVSAAVDFGAETVVSAVTGAAGLPPTWAAVVGGLTVALANKESLVLAGELVMPLAGERLRPVDSEHSAVFQALGGVLRRPDLRRLILTASGGPFRGWSSARLAAVGPREALRHPTWSMGPKISCDSATLMNKGLEVIEAHHLFGLDYGQIEVVVHPGSVVHSLAEFWDGSMLAQLGPADMRLALAYALSGPERWPLLDGAPELAAGPESPKSQACQKNSHSPTGLPDYRSAELPAQLLFEAPDRRTFKALRLAEEAGRAGGTAPATLNGANEEAVAAFLAERLSFLGVADVVEECLQKTPVRPLGSVDEALAADGQARILARTLIERRS